MIGSRLWLLLVLIPLLVKGVELDDPAVPGALAPWAPWVLRDADWRDCPLAPAATAQQSVVSDVRAGDGAGRLCAWPGVLSLDVNDRGGRFSQIWRLYAPGRLFLPGDSSVWPLGVTVNGAQYPVLADRGRPVVYLEPGEYALRGEFLWSRLPDGLALPAIRGPVRLRLNESEAPDPRLDADGQLWLSAGADQRQEARERNAGDTLALTVTRLIADGVPVQVTTRLELDVSGQPRELRLTGALLEDTLPLRIDSPLPARLDASGQLQLQLRPGRWVLEVQARYPGRQTEFSLESAPAPWPEREVWAFRADPRLRQVEISGVAAVDPRQTRLPPDWQELPAYELAAGQSLTLTALPSAPVAGERLRLKRELWLDFSGRGYSFRDRIQGEPGGFSRLDALAPLQLGQVRIDDRPRLITRLAASDSTSADADRSGIEVRGDRIDLIADGRLEQLRDQVPASGWAAPFEEIQTSLRLPPGWDLFAVNGVDNLPASWLARWSLLDLFLVLIAALAMGRLWGWRWGLVSLVTLVLIWQEPDAPRTLWLHLLAAAALLRLLPGPDADGAARGAFNALRAARFAVTVYFRAALVILVVVAVPFLVQQMRDGLYPQLSLGAGMSASGNNLGKGRTADAVVAEQALAPAPALAARGRVFSSAPSGDGYRKSRPEFADQANVADWSAAPPGAVLQTGAGVPDWNWNAFDLQWSGPVDPGHRARLWLIPPMAALLLACLQLLLMPALALRIVGWQPRLVLSRLQGRPQGRHGPSGPTTGGSRGFASLSGLMALMIVGVLCCPWVGALAAPTSESSPISAGQTDVEVISTEEFVNGFPRQGLLTELRDYLLAPADCLPDCLSLTRLHLVTSAGQLRLQLEVALGADGTLPVPGGAGLWAADSILLDAEPLPLVRAQPDGGLLLPVPRGVHRIELTASLAGQDSIELPLPVAPHVVTAELDPSWQLEGLRPDGQAGDQLRLVRAAAVAPMASLDQSRSSQADALAPLLRVERVFYLGLTWQVQSRAVRVSSADTSVSLWLPLLSGEAVTSAETQVVDGRLLLSLPPGRNQLVWSSSLALSGQLLLEAGEDPRLVERWCIGVSPLWHYSTTGIDPVSNGCDGMNQPFAAMTAARLWQPWPGERLALSLVRPAAAPGPTLTLDQSRYELTPGLRATDARLLLALRASEGQKHRIGLPAGASHLDVRIDGQPRRLALRENGLDLPLVPGAQQVELRWQQTGGQTFGYRPVPVNLGLDSVNATSSIHLNAGRWVLWTQGQGLGPAVLFWSQLVVLGLIAWWLGRWKLAPLRWFDWLLLGIGLSQATIWVALLVAGWLLVLGWRRGLDVRRVESMPAWRFDLVQVGLALWSLFALFGLLGAIQQGLLGQPRMQIAGNGSTASDLRWYLDHAGPELGRVLVVSVPMLVYRLLMLGWALWLALRLLDWLKWGWQALASPIPWRPLRTGADANRKGGSGSAKQAQLSVDL